MHWLDTLNRYANLLLVAVTIAYVVITARTLRAFRRGSISERRLRHLEDIKSAVVDPLLAWVGNEVSRPLEGYVAPPVLNVLELSQAAPCFRVGLHPSDAFGDSLFVDARRRHFAAELEIVERFRGDFEALLAGLLSFFEEAERSIAAGSPLPHGSAFMKTPHPFADTHYFVNAMAPALLAGVQVPLQVEMTPGGGMKIHSYGTCIAMGEAASLQPWYSSSLALVQQLWRERKMGESVCALLKASLEAHDRLMRIKRMQTLPGECAYVGKPD